MSFGRARNSGISWFRNYGDALHKYNTTTDIRGRTTEPKRPLGRRGATDTYSIVKRDDGAIQCVLYKTPVITFFPDNSVEITDGMWTTVSTATFIEEVMGYGVKARVFNGYICVNLSVFGTQAKEYRLEKDVPFKLLQDEHGYWKPAQVNKAYIHQVNKAGSNNVRKRYKHLFDYVKGVQKLRADSEGKILLEATEYAEAFGSNDKGLVVMPADLSRPAYSDFMDTLRKFTTLINNPDASSRHISNYHAFLILARACGYVRWNDYSVEVYKQSNIEAKLKELLWGIHREECFTAIELPDGELKRDKYIRYFESTWERFHEGT